MPIQPWSESIVIAELADEPQFSEDLAALADQLNRGPVSVVLDFTAVNRVNSSGLATLLNLRQRLVMRGLRLVCCGVGDAVWSVMLVTGLEKVFPFHPDLTSALAALQLAAGSEAPRGS